MSAFKDNNGRSWSVVIDVAVIKRVRSLLGVDLLEIQGGDLAERLAADPILMVDVLYVVCKPEADRQGITDEQFGAGLVGDAIDNATDALMGALIDFFPKLKRGTLAAAWSKVKELEEVSHQRVMAHLQSGAIDDQIRAKLDDLLPMPGAQSTNSPESSGSTPTP